MESVFTVKTVDLQESLTRIKRFNKKYFKEGIIKIRMMPGGIELSTIGVFEFVHGQTEGLAEVFAPLKLLFAFAQDCTHDSVTFKFRKGELECGNSIFSSPHISIKDWFYTTETNLSIKPTDIELLKLGHQNIGEIFRYNKHDEYLRAKAKLDKAITESYGILKVYNIKREEIEKLVQEKLFV